MQRRIIGFALDAESAWTAELACGHRQHTRHAPPQVSLPWVLTAEGRETRLGTELDCVLCDRSVLSEGFAPYRCIERGSLQ